MTRCCGIANNMRSHDIARVQRLGCEDRLGRSPPSAVCSMNAFSLTVVMPLVSSEVVYDGTQGVVLPSSGDIW